MRLIGVSAAVPARAPPARAKREFPDFPPLLRYAASLGRRLQDPLLEIAGVALSGPADLAMMRLHPLQDTVRPCPPRSLAAGRGVRAGLTAHAGRGVACGAAAGLSRARWTAVCWWAGWSAR